MSFSPQPCFVPPSFPLSLSLLATIINLGHVVLQVHIAIPHASWTHSPKLLISSYSLDRLYHRVVTHSCPEFSFLSFNFQWACIKCLLPVMYNARGLRCNTKQGRLHTLHLRRCQSLLQPSWPRLCPVSGMTIVHPPTHPHFCMFTSIHSSRPSSLPDLLLEAHTQNLWQKSSFLLLNSYLFFSLAL